MIVKYCRNKEELVRADNEASAQGKKLKSMLLCAECNPPGSRSVVTTEWKILMGDFFHCLRHFRHYVARNRPQFQLEEKTPVNNATILELVTHSRKFSDLLLMKGENHPEL